VIDVSVIKSDGKRGCKRLLKEILFMRLMIVAAAKVFEPRKTIAMFLSLSIGCHYKPYYETRISPFFCMILSCSISCSDLNGRVGVGCADRVDGAASFEFNNVLLFIMQNKA
jgi:hypothetical protein